MVLDREIPKELIDTKFVDYFEGLVLVLSSSMYKYMHLPIMSKLCEVLCFSAENPSLLTTCGSYI